MKTARLGNSELDITKVGLGTWAIGGPWEYGWGPQDDNDSLAAILEALDSGINWIDTAPVYGCGHSEEIVGKVLKQTSQKPIIATKCSLAWNDKREKVSCLKTKSIIAECDASLKRLGIDVIDLYQMHWPEPAEDLEEGYGAMAKCVKAGKVRYLGVSNFTVEQLKKIMDIHPVISLQPPYSMLRRDVEKELLGFCTEHNIGVIVYSPLQKGLLTGKFTLEKIAALPADDVRHMDANYKTPLVEKNFKIIARLKTIAKRNGITVTQLAIAWTLRRPEITAAIVGARRKGQITETAPAGDIPLSKDSIDEIEEILKM